MVQCCVCEDWFHREHLGLESSKQIPMDEDGEPLYKDLICLDCSKAFSFLAFYPQNIFVAPKKYEVVANDEKGKGILEDAPSCVSAGKICGDDLKPCDNGDIKPNNIIDVEGSVAREKPEKHLSLNEPIKDSSSCMYLLPALP
ncbi:unnamed protein product [Amaranthus hypochondriacus]